MFIGGVSVGIGLLFLSLLYLSPDVHKPSKLVGGIIVLLCWLVAGTALMSESLILTRLYIASIPSVFFLLLPMIYRYQQTLTAYGNQPEQNNPVLHWLPLVLASLLSLSIAFMPTEDFNDMFFNDSDHLSIWATINAAGFIFLLAGWMALSFLYFIKIVQNTKRYHLQLHSEFADHEGKRLGWLIGFICLLLLTWFYALLVLAVPSINATPFINETALSLMVLLLIWMFSIQALNRKPAFSKLKNETVVTPEQKYSNSSIDDERLQRIANKVDQKVMKEQLYLNPDIDASTLAKELGISSHYLSQVLSQKMQTTFYRYINDARIDAAKQALKTSQSTVLEIALSVGFNTRSSFYNAFKNRTGMTPSKYKALAK